MSEVSLPTRKVNVDRLLSSVGEFGCFQKFFYLLLCLPCAIAAFFTLAPVFTAAVPKHRCRVSACDQKNSTYQDAFSQQYAIFTIPEDKNEFSSCLAFAETQGEARCLPQHFNPNRTEKCHEWIFDRTDYGSTIVTEFSLTCDESWKVPLTQSAFFASVLFAAVFGGFLADRFGRKVILMFAILFMTVGGSSVAFAPNYAGYLGLQIVGAIGQLGTFQMAFILGVENVGKTHRVLCGVVIEYFFVLGEAMVALVAWREREWRKILMSVMIPSIGFLFYWPFMPESIRWLVTKKREKDAQSLVNRIAKWNKKPIPLLDDFKEELNGEVPVADEGFLTALKSRKFIFRAVNVWFCWLVVAMTYYGLSMSATSLSGDPYLNFLLVALVEVPGYTLSYFSMEKLGRRPSVSISLIVGGISILVDPFIPDRCPWLKIIFFLVGKTGVTCAFGTIYLYTSELYPTSIRNVGVGTSSMFGRVGAIVSPYVAMLALFQKWLPLVVFGVCAVVSGGLILFLPETLGKDLPDTLAEALHLDHPTTTSVDDLDERSQADEEADNREPHESDPLIT